MSGLRRIHAATFAAALVAATAATSSAAQPLEPALAQDAVICTPSAVAAFGNRIHVRCTTAVSGIWYFAVATSNSSRAALALALFSTALASGRDLRIYYDPANTSGTAVGCQAADCRLADGVEVL